MDKKRKIKIYKTKEEVEEFYRQFQNRIRLQEKLYTLSQVQQFFPDSEDRIIPISREFKFLLS
jgi:hypothetical protein